MSLRKKNDKWEYRFKIAGQPYRGSTGLAATARNRSAANLCEAEARKLVMTGQSHLLSIRPKPFIEAADSFITWVREEHRQHPNTPKRIETSFASLRAFFGSVPVNCISPGMVEDYKGYRRKNGIEDVTLRHDLHALSPFFKYARKHGWCSGNPVAEVEIPSDAEAVRIYVVSPEEERAYFMTASGHRDLYDFGRLMILQGLRPDEVLKLKVRDVDLTRQLIRIRGGKTLAARRTLVLSSEAASILATRISRAGEGNWIFPGKLEGAPLTKLNNAHDGVLNKLNPCRACGDRESQHKCGLCGCRESQHPTRKCTCFEPREGKCAHFELPERSLMFVLYDFRHTFATRMAQAGVDLATLAAILGHNSLRMVTRYVHPTQQHQASAMRRYEQRMQEQVAQTWPAGKVN